MNRTLFALVCLVMLLVMPACTTSVPPTALPAATQPPASPSVPALAPTRQPTQATPPTSTPEPQPTATPTRILPTPKPTAWEPQPSSVSCQPSATRTCKILYILEAQYDDEHVVKTRPVFEELGYTAVVASNTLEMVRGYRECYKFTPAYPELLLQDVVVGDYDAILFLGSDGDAALHRDAEAYRIAREALEQGKVVGALGDGPVVLARAGLLEGKVVNVLHDYPNAGAADQWIRAVRQAGAIYIDRAPVRDGLLVTSDFATLKFVYGILEVLGEQAQ